MCLQHVLNIMVNGQGVNCAYSHDQLKHWQVKAPIVGQCMPKPKGEDAVDPLDVFARLTISSGIFPSFMILSSATDSPLAGFPHDSLSV